MELIVDIIDYFLHGAVIFGLTYAAVMVVVIAVARRTTRKAPHHTGTLPPISVLKPLKGCDDELRENLISFFELDYPAFELIFGVDREDDPAVAIVRELQEHYPQVTSHLIISDHRIGLNPKVNNLANTYPQAKYDYFVISDSNVRVKRDYLTDLISQLLQTNVGLVTSTIRGIGAQRLGARLENIHLNSFIAGSVLTVTRVLKRPITIGKSMCFSRETFERIGGFPRIANYLAEDHILGQCIRDMGYTLKVSYEAVESINHSWSLQKFFNRHVRWATMRRHVNVWHYLAEMFSNPLFFALFLVAWRHDWYSVGAFAAAAALKSVLDMMAASFMGATRTWHHYFLVPLKDFLIALIWFIPIYGKTVNWRGNQFLVGKHTSLAPVAQTSPSDSFLSGTLNREWQDRGSNGKSRKFKNLLLIVRMAVRVTIYGTKRLFSRLTR